MKHQLEILSLEKVMNSLYPILRKVLVQVTKIATTVLLLIVFVYEGTDGYYYLYTPISFTIAEYIQISFITSLFLLILSISLRFCWRHQIGIVYLLILCVQRNFNDVLFTSNSAFLTICYTNIAVILVILFLGIQQFFRNIKSGQH
jgi:hypothetical protein